MINYRLLSEGAIKQESSRIGENKSPCALDFIECTIVRTFRSKARGKWRRVGVKLARQAAIPVGVGISNGRQDLKAPPSRNVPVPPDLVARTTGHRPFCSRDLPQPSPTANANLPSSTFHLRPPIHLAPPPTRIARRRGPFRVPLVPNRGPKWNDARVLFCPPA